MQVEQNAMLTTIYRHYNVTAFLVGCLLLVACFNPAFAQPVISYITPDAGAPGMTVAVEIIAPANSSAPFGSDQMYTDGSLVRLTRPSDSALVRLGPSIVSWNGHLIQQMFLLKPNTKVRDTEVYFNVYYGTGVSAVDSFEILQPRDVGTLSGGGPILAQRTRRNTLVVDSLILKNGNFSVPMTDPDPSTPGNQAYLPFRILSMGPIRLIGASIVADGSSGVTGSNGGNGGPGGGGGGSGYPGSGGAGYTGGGGDNDGSNGPGGKGTGIASPTTWNGGSSLNGAPGGIGEQHTGSGYDDGAGGGTGLPFGTSGTVGGGSTSPAGGYGGASAGGSNSTYTTDYGGGGGGFETSGSAGGGSGNNGGQENGNVMLIPLVGGSGGGAGNATYNSFFSPGTKGGSGGGGGGAIELTSFRNLEVPNGNISADGGAGSNANSSTFPAAGGGGGSGGAVSLCARDSIVFGSSSSISVQGAGGGSGQNDGGTGSVGRARLNGFVSTFESPTSSKYFTPGKDYTGPSIQRVTSTADSVYVHGYAEVWDGVPATPMPIDVFWAWPSSPVWHDTLVNVANDPRSHTAQWNAVFPNSPLSMDSQVYVVAVQDETQSAGTYTNVPTGVMSHTSGIISNVVGPPKLVLSDTVIDFGDVLVDSCSQDRSVEIYSVGRGNLIVDSVELIPPVPDFHVKTPLPATLPPGGSLALVVSFCPTAVKCPITAQLDIFSNAPPVPSAKVELRGCGIQPHAMLSPLVINFGRIHIGDCKDTFAYLIDTGSSPLAVTQESLGDPTHFKILDALPIRIAPGDTVKLNLEFCSSDTATDTSIDTIKSDAPESPNLLTLIGSGKTGVLSLPAELDFGLVHLDSCKDSGFYAKNTGNDSLLVTGQSLTGSGNFTILSPAVPFVIPADSSVFVSIQYCAMDTAAASAVLTQETSVPDSGSVLLLAHSGIGILAIADTINFGAVPTGSCIDTSIVVTNVGTDTLFLSSPLNLQPPFYYRGPSPLVLAPGASDSVKFRFCSMDTSAHSETASLDTVRRGISPAFTLLGKGIEGALATSGAVDLGCVAQGTDTTVKVTIRNTGTAALDSLTASVVPASVATIVHAPPSSLAPGTADSVVLTIPASTFGPLSATLLLQWSGGSTVKLPITGEVTTKPAILALDTSIAFDSTDLGDSSVTKCIRVTNYSCIALAVDSATIVGALPGEFEIVSNSASPSLSDSLIGTICIRYRPQRIGMDSAELVLRSGSAAIPVASLTGVGKGNAIGVELALDTVSGRPGEVVNVPVHVLNDVTSAAITSLKFRVTFNPMQLDLRQPGIPSVQVTGGIAPQGPAPSGTISMTSYSIGDKEITATYSVPLTGKPVVAELPFEILEPTANTASIHLASASFGTSPATLAATGDGEIVIEQCDTNNRVVLSEAPVDVAQNNPNPFSAHTSISVNVHLAGHVTVELYNALGRKVMVAFDGNVTPGVQMIPLDASSLASGAYTYITTWTGTGSSNDQPLTARVEKTMMVLGE